jgi:putative transposase
MAQQTEAGTRGTGGRPLKLTPVQVEALVAIVRERPSLSLNDLVHEFRVRTSISLSGASARKYLKAAGMRRVRPSRARTAVSGRTISAPPVPTRATRYGYNDLHRDPGDEARYPCGLTDSEWERVAPMFEPKGRPGRPPKYPRRQLLDAILYVLRAGCSWRMLPREFPDWKLVYGQFRRWQAAGLFETLYDELRALWRLREHRAPEPTAGVLDAQSVKTSPQGGPKGYDAGKKVKGRKRHLVTDTLGLLLVVVVTVASLQDRDAAQMVAGSAKRKVPTLAKLYVDNGYAGKCQDEIRRTHNLDVEVVRHPGNRNVGQWTDGQLALFPAPSGFVVLPKRWVVERTNAWNLRPRRLVQDHDRNLAVSTAWIWLAEARMLLRRLTASPAATA